MKVFLLFPFLIPSTTFAEYRVFNLVFMKQAATTEATATSATTPAPGTAPDEKKKPPQIIRSIQSTLDPVQYKDLYYVAPDEYVDYDATWMCKGRTDYVLEFCPNPKAQIPASNVSNQNTP